MPLALVEKQVPCIVRAKVQASDLGFELRHLRYFVAVADNLHFGRAAKALHISQPPLSRQIQDLERSVGARLFERSSRAVTLTAAGALFLVETKCILEQLCHSVATFRLSHDPTVQSNNTAFFRSRPANNFSLVPKDNEHLPPSAA